MLYGGIRGCIYMFPLLVMKWQMGRYYKQLRMRTSSIYNVRSTEQYVSWPSLFHFDA